MMASSKDHGDINTVTISGGVGAIAVGSNATAIQADGDVSLNKEAIDAQILVLEQLIKEHQDSVKLSALLKEALDAIASGNAEKSKPLWGKITQYGGGVSAIAGNILNLLFP